MEGGTSGRKYIQEEFCIGKSYALGDIIQQKELHLERLILWKSYTWEKFCLGEVKYQEELCNEKIYIQKDPKTSQFPTTFCQGQTIGRVTPRKSYSLRRVTHYDQQHTKDVTHFEDLHIEKGYILGEVTNLNFRRAQHQKELYTRGFMHWKELYTGKTYTIERDLH